MRKLLCIGILCFLLSSQAMTDGGIWIAQMSSSQQQLWLEGYATGLIAARELLIEGTDNAKFIDILAAAAARNNREWLRISLIYAFDNRHPWYTQPLSAAYK